MSRAVFSNKGSLIFYIDGYDIGNTGYVIDYTKGDSSKNISHQCKIKVIKSILFRNINYSKKFFIALKKKCCGKEYWPFVLHYRDFTIVICVKKISDWESDLLTEKQIQNIILFEKAGF